MALRHSRMTELGAPAPDFALIEPASGKAVALSDFADQPALVVMFICNHCPYVKRILDGLAAFGRDYGGRLAIVAISANDAKSHPQDGPAEMARLAARQGFTFPYLHDESQETALAYEAICTPDFFVFDRARRLAYRGRFDEATPGNSVAVTGAELRAAVDAVLAGKSPSPNQHPSMGCSIKWKTEAAPDWA